MSRRFQFRLRTLFVLIAAVAASSLFARWKMLEYRERERRERIRAQREATDKIWDFPTTRERSGTWPQNRDSHDP